MSKTRRNYRKSGGRKNAYRKKGGKTRRYKGGKTRKNRSRDGSRLSELTAKPGYT